MTKEIIAECGPSWHNIEEAKELINRASKCGVNAVKFQLYDVDIIKQANSKWYEHLKKVMITPKIARALVECGNEREIEVFFTPMKPYFIPLCEELRVSRYKVRSKDAYNDDLLLAIRQTNKPCYISRNSYRKLDPLKQKYFYTLYFDEKRPTRISDVMKGYSNLLKSDGYSCHCNKLLNVMSVMLYPGVNYIELHCSLNPMDKTLPDQAYSYGFTDIYELCRFRDLLNSRARENSSKWEVA